MKTLQRDLKDKKDKYESSVQYMYRNKSIHEKLLFIFSAENLSQTYRRLRYVREYANFQRLQAVEIERKQKQVNAKKAELEVTRGAKEKLLKEGEAEKKKLEGLSVLAESIRQFGVEVMCVEIDVETQKQILAAQELQKMTNV